MEGYAESTQEEVAETPPKKDVVEDAPTQESSKETHEPRTETAQSVVEGEQATDSQTYQTQTEDAHKPYNGSENVNQPTSNGISVSATYYTASCVGCSGVTATGYDVRSSIYANGYRVIAVDPSVIPLGSIVEVSTPSETFMAIAGDTGGAIKGSRIDILVSTKTQALSYGRVAATVRIVR